MHARFALVAAAALGIVAPAMAVAQHGGTEVQRAENHRATAALRTRIAETQARVLKARSGSRITKALATALQRRIAQTQQSMTRLGASQGFVSAAELASYNRTLGEVDRELDGRGVERSYGNDMLPAKR